MSRLKPGLVAVSALFVLAASIGAPFAAGDGACIEILNTVDVHGIRIIANAGQEIAIGFKSSVPANGVAFVAVIDPGCGGLGGVGGHELSGQDLPERPGLADLRGQAPSFLPLP